MGRLQRIEQRLERAINGAFAKAFRAEVQPVEIASAVRRAMDERAQSMTKGRTFVPADYTIELSPTDYERLSAYEDDVCDELLAAAEEHADSQRYLTRGPFTMSFTKGGDLETGVFRIHPDGRPGPRKREPASGHAGRTPGEPTDPAGDGQGAEAGADHDAGHPLAHVPTARQGAAAAAGSGLFDVEQHGFAERHDVAQQGLEPDAMREPEPGAGWQDATFERDAHEPGARGPRAEPPAHAGSAGTRAETARSGPDEHSPAVEARAGAHRFSGSGAAYDNESVAVHDPAPHTLGSATRREGRPNARPGRASDRPWLEIDGDRYPLLGPLTVLGRDTVASIVVEDANVSRRHCEVRVTSDGPHLVANIRDLGSTNGTYVNGQRVTSTRLHDRDQVTIGRTSMTFHAGR